MTLNEIAKKFSVGGLVKHVHKCSVHIGILLALHESPQAMATVAWYDSKKDDFGDIHKTYVKFLEPYGEIDAVKTLIEFAGRLLQDSPATICIGEEDKLKEAIDICEGAFGI